MADVIAALEILVLRSVWGEIEREWELTRSQDP
jgi:hypothetical protein